MAQEDNSMTEAKANAIDYLIQKMERVLDGGIRQLIEPMEGMTPRESREQSFKVSRDLIDSLKEILKSQDPDSLRFLMDVPNVRWAKLFENWRNYSRGDVLIADAPLVFAQTLQDEFGDSIYIPDLTQKNNQSGFGDSFGNHPFAAYLNKMLTNAVIKDSGNRVQLFKKSVESNLSELTDLNTAILSNFGEEAGTLFLEILDGLDLQEQERLGKAPKRAPKAEQVAEKVAQEEEVSLEELDFLDQEIEDIISLEELEDELNLDDLNLD